MVALCRRYSPAIGIGLDIQWSSGGSSPAISIGLDIQWSSGGSSPAIGIGVDIQWSSGGSSPAIGIGLDIQWSSGGSSPTIGIGVDIQWSSGGSSPAIGIGLDIQWSSCGSRSLLFSCRRTNLHLSLVWALVTMDSLGALGASLVELTRGEKHHAWDSAAAARQLQQHSGSDLGSDHNAIADVRAALDDLVRDSSNSGARAIKARAFLGAIQDVLAQQYGVPLRDMEVADEHHADEHDDDTPLPPASAYFAAAMSLLESLAADDDHHQDTRDHDAMAHDRSEHEGAGSVESASDDDAAGIVYLVSRIVPLLAASLLRRRLLPITRALTRLTHRFFHNEQVVQAVRSPTLPSIHTAGWQLTLVSWPVARASTRSERSRAPLSHASNNNELLLLQRRRLVVRYRRHRQHRERLTGRRYLA